MESHYLPRQFLLSLRQSNDAEKNKQFKASPELAFRGHRDRAIRRGVWRTRFAFHYFRSAGVAIDWDLGELVWRSAGQAFHSYAERRRKQRDSGARRILADFLIGAHAHARGYRLLILDERLYKAAFPTLRLETV